jgi:apolipoprotein N-acyltransferase
MSGALRRAGLAFLAGAIGATGLAPLGLWPVTLVALAASFVLFDRATTARTAFQVGWAFGTGFFAVALSWIVEPFFVQPQIHGWMAPFALLFMAAGLALFWAVAFGLAQLAAGHRMLALVVALALAEFARAYVLSGFPWAGIAQIWVGTGPDLFLASLGPHGLALATLLIGWALARGAAGQGAWPVRIAGLVCATVFVAAGFVLKAQMPEPSFGENTVRVVQPNAPQAQKWDPDMIPVFLERSLSFTAAGPRPDLIIWPESSVPTWLEYAGPIFSQMTQAASGAQVIAGINRRAGRRLHNAAILLTGGDTPDQIYDKHRLVPFGEYIPLGDLAARFGITGFAAREGQGFSPGPGPQLFDLGTLGSALPLICYEAIFPQLVRTAARPDMLIQITNDAWFGQISGPYQHLAQARMRAIEQGLPMIRSANTGISAIIDPHGRILSSIPLGQAGYADANLPVPLPPTLYSRTGDWPVLVMLLAAALGLVWHGRRANMH